MPHSIVLSAKFSKDGKTLTSFQKPVETADAFRSAVNEALDTFHKENPNLALFDGVTVSFDKVD